ncbi:bifunctional 3'-5' exonuclease/DNA polymerase [Nocardioides malaquae]|nr:bifunctional 3'-5' exonuclease/DNA polymerase [Nocardioides malaquae]
MSRLCLSRLPGGRVLVTGEGSGTEMDLAELPAYVSAREVGQPRWVWDDTSRWYPPLLAAGVRVERCHDLRLARRILRHAPAVAPGWEQGEQSEAWDQLRPSTSAGDDDDGGLFAADDLTEHLRADLEDARQQAAAAASSESGRLRLLVAAESSGALAAVEMTHAGVPWRSDVHEAMLTDLLGPRPPRGARPAKLEAAAEQVRRTLGAPRLHPDSQAEVLAALRQVGVELPSLRAHALQAVDHPAAEALLRYKQLVRLFTTNGWAWSDDWVRAGRFRPHYQPAGSATGRWSSNGGGALSFPAVVRPAAVADDGWVLVVADVAQLEPRVLAGMSRDRALAHAARGADLYRGMVVDGAVPTREEAKFALLGAMYGATRGQGGQLVAGLTRRYPAAFGLVEEAARTGERGGTVRTLLGRGSPPVDAHQEADEAGDASGNREAEAARWRAYGRFTRNFVVQGTGAEWALCWVADLRNRLWRLAPSGPVEDRPHLVLFLHDEVVIHAPAAQADAVVEAAHGAAATATRLLFGDFDVDFPLSTSVVRSYAEAGKSAPVPTLSE